MTTMTKPFTAEQLVYGFTAAGDPQVAPDGTRILFTRSHLNRETKQPESQLWLCDIDGGNARQITWSGSANSGGRWSPDGNAIAYISHRDKRNGIFVIPVSSTGEGRELTSHRTRVTDLAWSPDGARIAYTTVVDPDNPNEEEAAPESTPKVRVTSRIDYKQDTRGYLNDVRPQVFVVEVASGERRQITHDAVDHNFPLWSPDGSTLAIQVPNRNGMCSQLALVDLESGDTTTIGAEMGAIGLYAWSPSGDRLLYAGDTTQTWQSDFFVYDVAAKTSRRLTDDLQVLPAAGYPGWFAPSIPVWLDERQVLFHAVRAGGSGIYVIDAEGGDLEQLVSWQAQHTGLSMDASQRYIVQSRVSLNDLGEIIVYDTQSNESTIITGNSDTVFAEYAPALWERFDIERAGYTIESWLLKPPGFDETKQYPVILDIHGGPNGYYGYAFNPLQQLLVTNGYLVVYSNPRGSGSYGREFTQQVVGDWGGEDFKDLMAVLDAVLERPYADSSRTGIYGYSYGGYMTSWTLGQTDRFQAAVCGAPCFDLESFYGTSDIGHIFGDIQFGSGPHEGRAWYEAHSPSTNAHRVTTPTLIVHGESDERCPIGQGEQMFVALKKAGCEVQFARYPGGDHLFIIGGPAEHREDFLDRILNWFNSHLGEHAS